MATWPNTTTLPYPDNIEDTTSKPIIIEKSSSNFTQSGEEPTISVRTFKLSWSMLTSTEKASLITFFTDNMGDNFSWTHPVEETTYTTIFTSGDISFKYVGVDESGVWYYSTELSLLTTDPKLPIPVNTVLPIITGTGIFVGDVLSTSDGSWINNPSSYTYQWYNNGVAITGAISNTYTLTSSEENTYISIGIIASNSTGDSNETISDNFSTIPAIFIAKTIIIESVDNYGSVFDGLRSVELGTDSGFGTPSTVIPIADGDITTYGPYSADSWKPKYAFITSTSKIGGYNNTSWITSQNQPRCTCVFDSAIDFKRIIINNAHHYGGDTSFGVKNIRIYLSSDVITDTTYGATIPNSILLFDGQIAEHVSSDVVDDQVLSLIQP